MNITVIGTGYVGLVVGTCLADIGNNVICVDNNEAKVQSLKQGGIPIYEPGLEELVKSNVSEGRLVFSTNLDEAVKKSLVCFIAVGTPPDSSGAADLTGVYEVAETISKAMNGYKVVVNKSTVPVGTAEKIANLISANTTHSFDVVSNPEFLKQGSAVEDFLSPDRVIIGSNSPKAIKIMQSIYSSFLGMSNKIIVMDVKSAEMTKYAANSFLATKISFMNEIANLCEKVGADIEMVRNGISSDERIGDKFLYSGLGYGGSCFPKDVEALIKTGDENNCDMAIMKATNATNKNQRLNFVKKIIDFYGEDLSHLAFGVWGLSYKPKTNDMREAPSITILNELLAKGAKIKAYDPKAMERAKLIFGNKISYAQSAYEALENVDGLLLITEWNEFRIPDFDKVKRLMKTPVIFDGRNQYDSRLLKEHGFKYFCIGKVPLL